jgi:hypothetical protein
VEGEPPDVVAVETNWILDVSLHQDQGSEELLQQAERGLVQLLVPSFCIAESIKRFESIRQGWSDLQEGTKRARREILRSAHLRFADERLMGAVSALAETSDTAEREFWRLLERIARATRLLVPGPDAVTLTADLRNFWVWSRPTLRCWRT